MVIVGGVVFLFSEQPVRNVNIIFSLYKRNFEFLLATVLNGITTLCYFYME